MKRTLIILALLTAMVAIPFAMGDRMGQADANIKPASMSEAPLVKQSRSAQKGQVWTLAGSNVTNGFFVVNKVERVNGAIVVHGQVEGLIKTANAADVVADMPYLSLSLSAFKRSTVQLVGEKEPSQTFEDVHAAWAEAGAPVTSVTVSELASRRYS